LLQAYWRKLLFTKRLEVWNSANFALTEFSEVGFSSGVICTLGIRYPGEDTQQQEVDSVWLRSRRTTTW
jgi:hypothetical protein